MIFFEIFDKNIENIVGIQKISEDEYDCNGDSFYEVFGWIKETLTEAEYKGKKVKLNKPFRTPQGPKKFAVYVKNKDGKVIKVNFGYPGMKIKKYDPKAKKSFAARHKCHLAKDKTTPRYWSCRAPLSKGSGYW
ncbi:MAG: hypothetical protein NZZ41_00315 [Candidatus Dojkabacteria bacterium]|nr:hypothetical protein [Candidatus Dojkabacteria bacterium]